MKQVLTPAFWLSAAVIAGGLIGSAYLAVDHIGTNRADIDKVVEEIAAVKAELNRHRIDAAAKEAVDETFNHEIARLREWSHRPLMARQHDNRSIRIRFVHRVVEHSGRLSDRKNLPEG